MLESKKTGFHRLTNAGTETAQALFVVRPPKY